MSIPVKSDGRGSTTSQDSRFSRLESGITLVSADAPGLEHLPRLTAGAGEGEPDLGTHRRGSSLSDGIKAHVEHIQQPPPPWKERALRFLDTHPRVRRSYEWLSGPTPPVVLQPTPKLDSATLRWRSHVVRVDLSLESWWTNHTKIFQRRWLLFLIAAAYIVGLAFISRANSFITASESFIDCTSTYWLKDDGCGLNGQLCSPFTGPDFQFRCPGNCLSVTLANPRTIGAEQLVYETLVVGGGDSNKTYRGDSWICPAAIQAGLVSPRVGGCGTLRLVGNYTNFLSANANGISSIGFPGVFPLSFRFLDSTSLDHCVDIRDYAVVYNVVCTAIMLLLLRPSPSWIFWSLLCIGFWHISLFSDTRSSVPDLSGAFGTFLPALFVGYAFWRSAWRFTLPAFESMPLERAIWYLAPFWAGVHYNVLTAKIPIDRLVGSDLRRSGAVTALVVIAIIVAALVINQARVIRKTGSFFYYLSRYILAGIIAAILASLPTLTFRLHHYIAAIVLTPLTAFPTRLSAIYQAFLLGMFLQGVAKFGFDSILQTAAELRRDAPLGSSLPSFVTNSTIVFPTNLANVSVAWDPISAELANLGGWNGFSLLVDDVQRLTGQALSYGLGGLQAGIPHFFRLAYQRDGQSGDYTKAAILFPNGTWSDPLPGPS
ncbi:hypothetical protein FRC08_018953 [Ceratobasidium sp. 394]|nr:hypothetical protein FRC08_018953 [Ceratobasidium sp. 394]